MDTRLTRLKDQRPATDVLNREALPATQRRYEQMVTRREQLLDRMTFGLIGVHAGSLVALFAAVGQLPEGMAMDTTTIATVVLMSLLGLSSAGFSIYWEAIHQTSMAAKHSEHLSALLTERAFLELPYSDQLANKLDAMRRTEPEEEVTVLVKAPSDFAFSHPGLWLRNLSGAAWLGTLATVAIALWPYS